MQHAASSVYTPASFQALKLEGTRFLLSGSVQGNGGHSGGQEAVLK